MKLKLKPISNDTLALGSNMFDKIVDNISLRDKIKIKKKKMWDEIKRKKIRTKLKVDLNAKNNKNIFVKKIIFKSLSLSLS